jgi:rfaE bifunctional protein kinase chain/domain
MSDSESVAVDRLLRDLDEFQRLRVLVVGDLFLDEYLEGLMYEISKEGPIPVVRIDSRVSAAGAAGNLASSIRNLGAQVLVAGVVGDDANGRSLLGELEAKGIETAGCLVDPSRRTFTYTKVRARVENAPSREILRLDVLPDSPLSERDERRVLQSIEERLERVDAVVVLDQVHHLVTKSLLDALPHLTRAHPTRARLTKSHPTASHRVLLHGSSRDHLRDFHDFDLITPNDREANLALDGDAASFQSVDDLGRQVRERYRHRQVLLTLGADGMAIIPESGPVRRLPTLARDVVDVTGAGDALSSVAVLGNCLGWDLYSLGWAASHAAAIAIAHAGTHHVTRTELESRIRAATGLR